MTQRRLRKGQTVNALNAQTGTTYSFVLADMDRFTTLSNASAIAATIPPNSSQAFPVGAVIEGAQYGAGQVTLTAGAGVTLRSAAGLKTGAQYASFAAVKIATDEWLVLGRTSP